VSHLCTSVQTVHLQHAPLYGHSEKPLFLLNSPLCHQGQQEDKKFGRGNTARFAREEAGPTAELMWESRKGQDWHREVNTSVTFSVSRRGH
jgi:hypothetical protein